MNCQYGIHSWGFAIPHRRLNNASTQEAWGRPPMPGSRSIAGHDEDTLTLAVQAGQDALAGQDLADVGLVFASTTATWAEKSSAVFIAETLGLSAHAMDLAGSLRGGSNALIAACGLMAAGTCKRVLVIATDIRHAKPGAMDEFLFGHAGVAVLLGPAESAVVQLLGTASCNHAGMDTWRSTDQQFPQAGDIRFARQEIYTQSMGKALDELLETCSLQVADVARVALFSPDIKSGSRLLQKKGFNPKVHYMDRVSAFLGLTGTPHALLMLTAALEKSATDDIVLALDYGDGASAFAFKVTKQINSTKFKAAMKSGYDISYTKYLSNRSLLAGASQDDQGFSSEIMADRNKDLWYSLIAKRCDACEAVITLPLPHCQSCGPDARLTDYKLQRTGTVFAVTHEHYYPTVEPPLGMAVIDLDGGGRMTLQVCDENATLQAGDSVDLHFRCLHNAGGRPNYFWKCRKVMSVEAC